MSNWLKFNISTEINIIPYRKMANPENVIGIKGAFEVYKETPSSTPIVERLVIQTSGKLPQRGDVTYEFLPSNEVSYTQRAFLRIAIDTPVIIGTVNKLSEDSPDCDLQSRELQALYEKDVNVMLVSKQDPATLKKYAEDHHLGYTMYSMSPESAIDLGISLTPQVDGEGKNLQIPNFGTRHSADL